jgi:hypothetical protein
MRANDRMLWTLMNGAPHIFYTKIEYMLDFSANFMYNIVYEFHLLI